MPSQSRTEARAAFGRLAEDQRGRHMVSGRCGGYHTLRGEEGNMHTDRAAVVRALRSRGEHDRAIQAACALPQHVDTERDAGVLHQLEVTVEALDHQPPASC